MSSKWNDGRAKRPESSASGFDRPPRSKLGHRWISRSHPGISEERTWEIVNSWVGTGQNLPVTPSQIEQGFGNDVLNQMVGKTGLAPSAVGSQLAGILPDLVDKLTPDGKTEAGGLDQLLKLLQGK